MQITIAPDPRWKKLFPLLPKSKVRQILISSINDASKRGETRLNKLIRDTIRISQAKADAAITRTTKRDDDGGFVQDITTRRQPIDLKDFHPKQTKAGLSVQVLTGGKRELIRHAFIAKGKANEQAFLRTGKARLPIRKLQGPTAIGAELRNEPGLQAIQNEIAAYANERISSKLVYELQKPS